MLLLLPVITHTRSYRNHGLSVPSTRRLQFLRSPPTDNS